MFLMLCSDSIPRRAALNFGGPYEDIRFACLGVKIPEEFLEGGHVGRLEHTPLLALLGGVPAVGNGSIQNPG